MHLKHHYRAHPWHGVDIGRKAPNVVSCYIEIVPTDTVKYELDKSSGLLKVDRPQKYSNYCPALYGLLPQTYCGKQTALFSSKQSGKKGLVGDADPLDICILAERQILKSDILLQAIPIGGFRCIDKGQADDKIIAVLEGDLVYGKVEDIHECPAHFIDRLHHYFLTYKSWPGHEPVLEILATYGREEALEVIRLSMEDYKEEFSDIYKKFNELREKT